MALDLSVLDKAFYPGMSKEQREIHKQMINSGFQVEPLPAGIFSEQTKKEGEEPEKFISADGRDYRKIYDILINFHKSINPEPGSKTDQITMDHAVQEMTEISNKYNDPFLDELFIAVYGEYERMTRGGNQ